MWPVSEWKHPEYPCRVGLIFWGIRPVNYIILGMTYAHGHCVKSALLRMIVELLPEKVAKSTALH